MADRDRISLVVAIDSLRKQIIEAADKAKRLDPTKPRFRITQVELELTVVAEDSGTVGAEVGWWILKGNAKATQQDSVSQRVKLTLDVGAIDVGAERNTRPNLPEGNSA